MQDNDNVKERKENVKIHELIAHLKNYPGDAEVIMWDCDGGADFPCTGGIYDHAHKTLELSTELGDES